ncbi:non-ribosomal peptide synthetase [Hymenobacter aquaticus]|uniref:non-ribosomal peptide synthetase n=1 Tax=Hymenobacter aquaticus TaxID=1867101 RepID=UPI0014367B58|nr:non-ribosomal peptide synthetase [Hymenobacter aquaticus]
MNLRAKGTTITLDDTANALRLRGKTENLTAEDKELIRTHKAALMDFIREERTRQKGYATIAQAPAQTDYALSDGQRRLWFLSQSEENALNYNIPSVLELTGALNAELFEQAIASVVARHEILRTVFRENAAGEPRQHVLPTLAFRLRVTDLRGHADADEQVRALVRQDLQVPFDLSRGPLLRATLFQLAADRHVFYYNMHHIVSDGWSMQLLTRDVLTSYLRLGQGHSTPPPALPIQYKDYAHWHSQQLSGESLQTLEQYWNRQFAGELPVLQLPSSKTRPALLSSKGAFQTIELDAETTGKLKKLSQERGGTLFMGLLAVVKGLLYRYTGQEDIIIGSPIAGREHADLQEQIGFYVNTLALRTRFSADDSFETLFDQVKATTLGAFQHQLYPFDRLVETLALRRDPSRNPLFDVLLNLQPADVTATPDAHGPALASRDFAISQEIASKFDLSFRCYEHQDALSIRLEYNTDVLESSLVEQLGRHLTSFVAAVLRDATQPVGRVNYIGEEEQAALALVNPRADLAASSASLLTEFTSVVSRFGTRVAVSGFGGEQLSYAELDALSSQLAHFLLAEAGAQPLSLVALALPQSPAVIVALLASWKAGAAYLPLDSSLPAARQQYMLRHSQAQLTLTAERYQEFLTQAARYPTTAPTLTPQADPTAYVIYTSGSTGQPKGVAVGHGSLRNYCQWFGSEAQLTEQDVSALLTSYSFDLGYTVLFPTLLTGGQLCLSAPEAVLEDAAATLAWLEARQVSFLKLTPSLVQGLVLSQGVQALATVGKLRLLVCGGATMAGADMAALLESNPQLTIFNHYGPTETTIGVCFQRLTQDTITSFVAQPVLGGPIANVELLVADARQQPVPVGVVGELLIGGRSLAQGYLHEAGLTHAKFVAHPSKPGQLMYRSGDQVVRQADGRLRFVGRVDEQVKVRGYRVEPGEVQHALLQLPGLAQAAVIAVTHEGTTELVAYVVPTNGHVLDQPQLRTALQQHLPAYMVPGIIIELPELPVTANGKLDRAALPDPHRSAQSQRTAHYQAPQGAVETALATVWASVLRRENISRQDNFYDLGGDSIKAVMVVSRLKQAGYSLKVSDVLRTPVLAELAEHAQLLTRQIDQGPVTGEVELTPIQHEYFGRTSVDLHHYNQSILLTSQTRLVEESLRQSLAQLLAHHDGLRLRFTVAEESGRWCQHYAAIADTPVLLHVYDLTQLPAAEARAAQLSLSEQLQASFELAAGPLFKAAVFRQPDGTDELLLVAHHLVVDGVSWRILLEDLSTLYTQAQQGQPLQLPAKTDSLQVWQAQQQQQARSGQLQQELAYWLAQDQTPVHALPLDQPAGSNQVADAQVQAFVLPAELTGQLLTQTHRALGTEVQELLLTGLTQALQAQWPLGPVRLTLEGHGREWLGRELDVTRTVGWFTSKYPLVLDVRPAANSVEALIEVKEAVRRLPGKGIGYGLLRYLHPAQPLAGAPNSDIVFNYLGDFGAGAGNADAQQAGLFSFSAQERGASVSSRRERSSVLEVSALIVEGQLRVSVSYSQQQYQRQTIAQLLAHYERHLTELIGTVAALEQRQLTPSDLTFSGLSRQELAQLSAQVGAVQDVYGLTPLQEGMYYHWVQDAGSRAHGIQVAYRLEGQLQVALLEQSYQQLVQSYDVLRTSFTHHYGGRALQVVQPRVSGGFHFVDLSHLLGEALASAVAAEKEADLAQGFDLSRGSQMRLRVLQLSASAYEFIWSHHHVIMDGWCSRLLSQQFTQLYQGLVSGQPVQLLERHKYADYLRWLDQRDAQASLYYWKDYLQGYEQPASLPKKTAAADTYTRRHASFQLDGATYGQLQQLCRQQGVTLNTVVQSAWGVLLGHYADTQDVVFGSVVSGRPGDLVGVEDMIGLFINTIPVRIQYGERERVRELIARQHQQQLNGEGHHYRQLAEVQAQTSLGRNLFDHILVFENLAEHDGDMGSGDNELSLAQSEVNEHTSYDLHVTIVPREASLEFHFNYNGQCYDDFIITGLEAHFKEIVGGFCANDDQPVAAIEYLSAAETTYLLEGLNDTAVDFPADKTIVDMFAGQVARRPQAVALRFADSTLTYQQLDEMSNQLAHYLRQQHDVQLEDRVAVQLDRGPWMIVSILATLKAGGAYVPIDPAYPADRIAYLVEDSQCKVCLDAQQIDLFRLVQPQYPTESVPVALAPTNLAYVLYTSGSTGKPKGCMLEHRGVVNRLEWMWKEYNFTSADVILQKTTFTFDVSVWELLLPLGWGCEMVLCEKDDIYSPSRIAALIARYGVTCLHFVPSMLNAFIGGLWESKEQLELLAGLRCVMTSGEALALESVKKWYSELSVPIYNLYGPTEASIDVTYYNTTPESTKVPIGKPVANTQILILDRQQRLVPLGVVGEIYIGGIQLARGYWNREELTREKFVAHPYQPGARLYRTGDLGRWLPDGNVEYLGRTDFQVKIRGYRIELGEIESALLADAGVAQAAVIATKHADGDAALVAYVVPAAGEPLTVDTLRATLQEQLPAYMVPSYFVQLAELPLTANGKLDRKALPDPAQSQLSSRQTQYEVPRGDVETKLADVWASVLRREHVGRQDNFYDLGGDSIKSILVVSRLRQQGYSVEVADILGYPVLAELAQRATKLTRQISQATATGSVELSPIQHEFLGDTNVDRHFFNQAVLLTSRERLNEEWLRQSLAQLLAHHDGLRLRFTVAEESGRWCQHYAAIADTPVLLHVYDLTQLPAAEAQAAQLSLSEQLQASFELATGPLFQAAVFRQPDGTDELLLVAHHLVVDGVSWRILLEDLSTLYSQAQQGQALQLPAKTDSLQAWQAQQQQQARSGQLQAELAYWLAQDQTPVHALPLDQPAGSNQVADAQVQAFVLPAELTGQLLTQTHRALGTEVQELLLTGLTQALQAQWPLGPVRLTLEGHGREWLGRELDVTRTVGWFTSKYPLVLDVRPAADSVEALIEVKEAVRRLPGKGIGYGLLRYLHPAQPLAGAPASDIVFNYLGDFGAGANNADEQQASLFSFSAQERGASVSSRRERSSVLEVSAMIVEGQLRVSVSYSQQQYQRQTIAQLLAHYEQHLTELIGTVAALEQRQLTPSDLTFSGLNRQELAQLTAQVGGVQDVYGLTPLQEGMYYHWVQDAGSRAHGIQVAYRLEGQLQVALLEQSYQQLVSSYDVLRTSFTHHYGGRALQVVQPRVSGGFHFVDLSHLSGEQLAQAVAAEKEADLAQGFDLSRGSQMRLRVLQLGASAYEFIWSHHHVIMDGWCSRLLSQQFTQLYQGLVSGQPVQLLERHKYADYLRWLDRRDAQASLAYWKDYLKGYEQPASLPKKVAANDTLAYAQAEVSLDVEPALVNDVYQLCRQQGVTLNTVVQSAWGVLLSRYTNTPDVVFGSVVSGRPGSLIGVEEMIGLFINTIPVRVNYSEQTTVRELLHNVQRKALSTEPHHYSPLANVRAQSELGRDLFNHVLVFENLENNSGDSAEDVENAVLKITGRELYESTNFDFHINCIPTPDSIRLEFKYNTNIFEASFIAALKEHFVTLLTGFVTAPEQVVDTVEHLPLAEKNRLLVELNDTATDYPLDQTVIDLFAAQVARTPNRPAVVYGATTLTYQQLDVVTNRLAQYLVQEYGVGANDFVGIQLYRSEWLMISVLGALKAGAAYVPIDPEYPQERIDYIRQDSRSKVLLDEQEISRFRAAEGQYADEWTAVRNQPGDLAYAIYTSGTTGRPKGVPIQHHNLTNYISYAAQTYCTRACTRDAATCPNVNCKTRAGSTFPLFTSFSFDLTVTCIFAPLVTGGKVVVYGKEGLDEVLPDVFWGAHGITVVKCTPTHIGVLSELGKRPTAVQKVIVGGEQLKEKHVSYLLSINPDIQIYNEYGPTETTVGATVAVIDQHTANITIGVPIANTQVFVLDRRRQLAAVGVEGEIVIAGEQLSEGYLNRPDLTAEKFVPHPYKEGAFIYLTGDTGKVLPDGNLLYFGRRDDQVKVRGYRIELGEVENALLLRDDISQAVVVATEMAEEKVLVAYFTSPGEVLLPELKGFLAATLPDYMVPAYLVQLKELPVTVNGKVDKRQLPSPDSMASGAEFGPVAPRNEVEEKLLGIWKQVLKKDTISIRANFFDLGGDSIKIILMVAKIKSGFKIALDSAKLFYATTIEEQAKLINEVTEQEAGLSVAPVQRSYPLTEIQEVYWAVCQDPATSVAYNISMAYQLTGALEVDKLQSAFHALQNRHEILRTVFRYDEQAYNVRQWVLPLEQLPEAFVVRDLRAQHLSPADLTAIVNEEVTKSFDFVNGPLIQLQVVQHQTDEYLVLFNMHHIISDAFSIHIIVRELFSLYANQVADQAAITLPTLPIQFKDYADWSRKNRNEAKLAESAGFWKTYLTNYDSQIRFPWRQPNVPDAFKADIYRQVIEDEALVQQLRTWVGQEKGTLYMALLTLFKALCHLETDQADLTLVTPVSTRDHEEVKDLIGLFLNTVFVRTQVAEQESFASLFGKVQASVKQVMLHKQFPYLSIVDQIHKSQEQPFFNVGLNLNPLNAHANDAAPDLGLELLPLTKEENFVKAQLWLDITEREKSLAINYSYQHRLFEERDVQQLAAKLERLLGQVLREPNRPLLDIREEMLAAERQEQKESARKLRSANRMKLMSGKLS